MRKGMIGGVSTAVFFTGSGLAASALAAVGTTTSLTVKGTDTPWLAGRTDFTIAPLGAAPSGYTFARDDAHIGTETFPQLFATTGGQTLQFSASGSIDLDTPYATHVTTTPDGLGYFVTPSSIAGISGYNGPEGGLLGVFLNDNNPQSATPPARLNPGSTFLTLSPGLNQVFFIGDGFTGTGSGSVQTFTAPAGATRLFLGTVDVGYSGNVGNIDDNTGSYAVSITALSVPEPATAALAVAAAGLTVGRRRKDGVGR